jgi:hypothetical protein
MSKKLRIVLFSLIIFIVLGGSLIWGYQRILHTRQISNSPPTAQIQWPKDGYHIEPDSLFTIQVTAWGSSPLNRIEIWLDGHKIDESFNSNKAKTTFNADLQISISAGNHILVARAIDEQGLVGQSLPMTVFGDSTRTSGETLFKFPTRDESTLVDLANDIQIAPKILQDANPSLGDQVLPPGTVIDVPVDLGNSQPVDPLPDFPAPASAFDTPPGEPLGVLSGLLVARTSWVNILPMKVPAAPDNLEVMVTGCKLRMRWNDNADNEDYYQIWMEQLGRPARVIEVVSSSAHTGPVWFESEAPPAGMYSFWVESVNKIANQPSEVVPIGVAYDSTCKEGLATQLQVEIVNMYLPNVYDGVYCYISVEGVSEKRFPPDEHDFLKSSAMNATVILPKSNNIFTLPLPKDQNLDIEGTCIGTLGREIYKLGTFTNQIPVNFWDGRDQLIESEKYRLMVRVKPLGSIDVSNGVYSSRDLTLPIPYDLGISDSSFIGSAAVHALHWKWDGNPNDITGFTVYLNGNPYKTTSNQFLKLDLPPDCSVDYGFQVVANSNQAESQLSEGYVYSTTPCQLHAVVDFQALYIAGDVNDRPCYHMADCFPHGLKCHGYEASFFIFAKGTSFQGREFPKSNFHKWPINCGGNLRKGEGVPFLFSLGYPFTMLTEHENVFIVGIDPQNPVLRFGTVFVDHDDFSANDVICAFDITWDKISANEWATFEFNDFIQCGFDTTAYVKMRIIGAEGPAP